jgi:pimeloyl-ACP methyl ester carboxylesterase
MSKSPARVRGIEMAYDDTGGDGAALVLLHGFPFDRSMWREQASSRPTCVVRVRRPSATAL